MYNELGNENKGNVPLLNETINFSIILLEIV